MEDVSDMTNFLSFDGQSGVVTVSGYKGIAGRFLTVGTSDRSISCWIRTTVSGGPYQVPIWWGDDLENKDVPAGSLNVIRVIRGKAQLFGNGSGRKTIDDVNDGQWHHVVFTYDGYPREAPVGVTNFAEALVYLDGEPNRGDWTDDGLNNVNTVSGTDVVIGAQPVTTVSGISFRNFFEGDIDEVVVYREVIPQSTVSGLYNGGVRGVNVTTLNNAGGIELWLTMGDDPSDTAPGTIYDQVGFRHGTATSGTSIGS